MSSPTLDLERSLYIGNAIGCILYGLLIYMVFHSIRLLSTGADDEQRRTKKAYVWYGIIMLFLMTFAFSANVLMGQLMWIEHRDYPGGPVGYWTDKSAIWFNVLGSAADVLGDFMSDALLLHRCYLIWNKRWYIIALPLVIYVASMVIAIISVVESALPQSSFFAQQSVSFGVPWIALTCGLNVIVTFLIAGRILYVVHGVRDILSPETTKMYAGVIAILVESALPFSILGIIFAVLLGRNFPEALAFSVVWGAFVSLAPQLIILRVAMGSGWTENTSSRFHSSLKFATLPQAASHSTNTTSHPTALESSHSPSDTSAFDSRAKEDSFNKSEQTLEKSI